MRCAEDLRRAVPGLLALAALSCGGALPESPADLILSGGPVITLDPDDRVTEALAVRGGRIVAVGTPDEIAALAGPQTRRIDLAGRAVTPGLLDAHAHFSPGQWNRPGRLDLSYPTVESIEEVQATVAERASEARPDQWIQGGGWDEGKLAERRLVVASDIDAVESERPVWLSQTMGHYGTANSVALRLAGIDRNTPDPVGGTIDRGPDGEPTGVLKETAQDLVIGLIPDLTPDDRASAIRELARSFNAECMTGAKDPGVPDVNWQAYQRVRAAGDLSVRVFVLWEGGRSVEDAEALIAKRAAMTKPMERGGEDLLIPGGVKLFADGSGGARTAWMYDEWNRDVTDVDAGNRGYPNIEPETLSAMIRRYHDAGLHVSTHAVGDRTIDVVVDSYDEALRENPTPGLRHGIIHANVPTDHALQTMARLQRDFDAGYPEPSSNFTWWIGDTYAGNFGARARRLNPFATYLRLGIRWANGSDYSVTPFPARYGVWASIARQPALGIWGGDPFGREEAVDVTTALRAQTLWVAHQMFLEDVVGSIEVGKYADLAVWDRDPLSVPTDELKDLGCELTLLGGRVVHSADGGVAADP